MRPTQVYDGKIDVLEAARRRFALIFDHFETIIVSVSGGKDSTVLAHLAAMEARRRGRRLHLFFLDEEVVYQATIDQIAYLMEEMAPEQIIPLWLQVEFHLTNATSQTETQLIPWEAGKHKLWMRPKKSYAIKHPMWDQETQTVADKNKGFGFYDVIMNFEGCYQNTAFLVGLRAVESMNRWRAMVKNPVMVGGDPVYWGTNKGNSNVALYPLYDWNFTDVWRYIHEQGLRYHRIYDYQMMKGYPINEMRISSLIHEKSFKSICDLPEFEPDTYNRLAKRAKGIILAQETGKSAKMFRARKKPKNFPTWRAYRDFLLETHQDQQAKAILSRRFAHHLDNEYVARQQVRQLVLNDFENNLPVDNKPDPRQETIRYYMENL